MTDTNKPSFRTWHIPLSRDDLTLRAALESLKSVGEEQPGVPLMVQIVENPKYRMPGVTLFHGAVDLETHDCIHLVLGRGLLPKDEAFAIGFTMGSTHRFTNIEETLFGWISKHLYPGVYRFTDEDLRVFRDAAKLGMISDCRPLDEVNFRPMLDWPLREIRSKLGIEVDLLRACYAIEKRRFPNAPESQRLL